MVQRFDLVASGESRMGPVVRRDRRAMPTKLIFWNWWNNDACGVGASVQQSGALASVAAAYSIIFMLFERIYD